MMQQERLNKSKVLYSKIQQIKQFHSMHQTRKEYGLIVSEHIQHRVLSLSSALHVQCMSLNRE
jgi:hypothetical protein